MSNSLVLDDRAFLAGLHNALVDFTHEGEEDQHDRAERVLEAAKQFVHVDSGETRDSLEITDGHDEDGRFWEVGSSLEKAIYENFGTSKMAAQHFMTAALAQES